MLVLRNIKREGNVISADYYPEREPEFGHIEIDSVSGEVISLKKLRFICIQHLQRMQDMN